MNLVPATFLIVSLVVLVNNCSGKYDVSQLTDDCLKKRAIAADYDPLGNITHIGDLPVYEYEAPNNLNKKRMLIAVYDVFGFAYPNMKQVVDQIAVQSGGFLVTLPDFFRGDGWDIDGDFVGVQEWLDRVGDWDLTVKPDLINLVRHYQETRGVEEFAIFGMCFGGEIATLASIELSEYFKASGSVHASLVTDDQAEKVLVPMYLMPGSNDPDMSNFYQILQRKFGDNCGHRRFDDVPHGFASARGNFSDPVNRERVEEVITKLGVFFDHNLNATKQSSSAKLQSYKFAMLMTMITTALLLCKS